MDYNDFKGMKISKIGMGCYALSGSYGSVDKSHYKKVLKKAHDLGVNFFDTADTYGDEAEEILGEVVKPFRDEVYISTKVGIREGVKPNLSYDYVKKACQDSLDRLQTDYIDFYLIHFNDPENPKEETIKALEELKDEGKIRHYGVSHISKDNLKEYLDKGNVSVAMMELNAAARTAKNELLPLLKQYDTGGLAFSVTGRGILTGKYGSRPDFEEGDLRRIDPLYKRARLESSLRILDKLKGIGKKYDKTPVQVAIQWVLSQPGIVCALTGPSKIEHLEENIGGSGWTLSADDFDELEYFLEQEDIRLEKEEPSLVKEILYDPLPDDKSKAYTDLIYAIETAITHEMMEQDQVMPYFRRLLSLERSPEGLEKEQLEEVQVKLRDFL